MSHIVCPNGLCPIKYVWEMSKMVCSKGVCPRSYVIKYIWGMSIVVCSYSISVGIFNKVCLEDVQAVISNIVYLRV